MSRGFNRVVLIGNVGKDPEVRYTTSGVPVATFALATSEMWKDKDGSPQERTDWHNVVAWRKLAEIIQEIVKKGSRLLVEGKIQTRSYEKNGEKRYVTEIVADNVLLLDGRKNADEFVQHYAETSLNAGNASDSSPSDEELPF
ncbi:MAG: single-stranded DNA-binding protein [Candidatus Kapaibacterium sp.]|nr:MAG: single-stranded DNA-binding protein [Candidatus Kapabacteria bacterium]